ncbi:MAG: ELM1/GtrOC1 family putative glycosyltransferase, partial [Gammaproteobacteria bacterium]
MIIWRFVDDRPGHENQTQGLIQALQALSDMTVFEINVLHQLSKPWHWLTKYFPAGDAIPAPDLLLGAGHATHWPMLVARHTFGGRVVVLMQPSFPLCWFDLCVIPEHDHPDNSKSVFVTKGVLNKVQVQDVRSDTR